jgi:hypothetical protein
MSKHIVTIVRFDYTLTDPQFTAFEHDDPLGMAIDAYLDPEPGDAFDVTVHSIVEAENAT